MAIKIERQGQRVYLIGNTFAHKDAIKAMGGHWDGDRRAWWVGVRKEAEARKLLEEIGAGFDLRNETDRAVRADQLEEAGKGDEAAKLRQGPPKQDPDTIRLTGKGRYKGLEYYAGSITEDGARVRLLTLPDAEGNYLDFWADCAEVEEVKRYESRQVWDGRRYSGKTVTQYTTLGGIAKFVAKQKRAAAEGLPACAACGKRGELIHDLEDGLAKCRGCCDIPE